MKETIIKDVYGNRFQVSQHRLSELDNGDLNRFVKLSDIQKQLQRGRAEKRIIVYKTSTGASMGSTGWTGYLMGNHRNYDGITFSIGCVSFTGTDRKAILDAAKAKSVKSKPKAKSTKAKKAKAA